MGIVLLCVFQLFFISFSTCFIKVPDRTSLFALSGMSGIQLNHHAEEKEEGELRRRMRSDCYPNHLQRPKKFLKEQKGKRSPKKDRVGGGAGWGC